MSGLDWPGLMRIGMGPAGQGGLGLAPSIFWSLSPAELALMLGLTPGQGAMTRDRLAELATRFPDATPQASDQSSPSHMGHTDSVGRTGNEGRTGN